MDGVYFGGNTDRDILCLSPTSTPSNEKRFRLTVQDNVATLSSQNTTIYINGKAQDTPLKNRKLKPGDLIGIGCQTSQESIDDPAGYVFEFIKHERPSPKRRDPNKFGCHHPPSEYDFLKALNRVDCPYRNCFFACWNMGDLNEHLRTNEEHIAEFEKRRTHVKC